MIRKMFHPKQMPSKLYLGLVFIARMETVPWYCLDMIGNINHYWKEYFLCLIFKIKIFSDQVVQTVCLCAGPILSLFMVINYYVIFMHLRITLIKIIWMLERAFHHVPSCSSCDQQCRWNGRLIAFQRSYLIVVESILLHMTQLPLFVALIID